MSLTNFIQVFPIHIIQEKKMTYRTSKPPSQSVYSGVCHRLALTSKIAIGFRSGVRHRLGPYVQDYYQIDHEPTTHLHHYSNEYELQMQEKNLFWIYTL